MPKTKPRSNSKNRFPYIRAVTLAAAGLVLGLAIWTPRPSRGVLAYATDISINGLLTETNTERSVYGKPSLLINPALNQAAQAKANDMAGNNYWAHTSPAGTEPWVFMEQAGYSYKKAGENLAYGFATSQSAVRGWMNSPTHRSNLLDDSFQEVGFGFVNANNYQGAKTSTIVVAMYGTPLSAIGVQGKVSDSSLSVSTDSMRIARLQVATNGQAPWSMVLLITITAAVLSVIVFKHSRAIRRAVNKGERFVLHHPLLDIAVLALAILTYIAAGVEGYIL